MEVNTLRYINIFILFVIFQLLGTKHFYIAVFHFIQLVIVCSILKTCKKLFLCFYYCLQLFLFLLSLLASLLLIILLFFITLQLDFWFLLALRLTCLIKNIYLYLRISITTNDFISCDNTKETNRRSKGQKLKKFKGEPRANIQ